MSAVQQQRRAVISTECQFVRFFPRMLEFQDLQFPSLVVRLFLIYFAVK